MTSLNLMTALQILVTFAAFAAVMLGCASSAVRRRLGRRARPYRMGKRRALLPAPTMGVGIPASVPVVSAGTTNPMSHRDAIRRREQRAA